VARAGASVVHQVAVKRTPSVVTSSTVLPGSPASDDTEALAVPRGGVTP